jgi:hypothetical protein
VTRIVSPDYALEAEKPSITMVVLVELAYDSGTIRVHDGIGSITISELLLQEDGDGLLTEAGDDLATEEAAALFYGLGELGSIEAVEENIEVIARSVNLTVSGLDASLLTEALSEDYQNRTVTIYLGMVSPDTGTFLASPEVIWEGRMNQQTVNLSRGEASIQISCEHRLRREPRIARYTDADQKQVFPGDRFFDLTPNIEGFVSKWGARDVGYGGPGFNPRGPGSGGGIFSDV